VSLESRLGRLRQRRRPNLAQAIDGRAAVAGSFAALQNHRSLKSKIIVLCRWIPCWVQVFMQQPRLAHVSTREAIRRASSDI
jgi:hypothetical protein